MTKTPKKLASEKLDVPEKLRDGRPDPNVIPTDDMALLTKLGLAIGGRVKRGRYGVVFEGRFTEDFSLDKLRRPSENQLHYAFVRPDRRLQREMSAGNKFAIKFCDIETRKAYNVDDMEQCVKQELNFIHRVTYEPDTADWCGVVHIYCVFATRPSRYFILMELADNNLQCLIAANNQKNLILEPLHVLKVYECLICTIKSLHRQKLTYGSLRTSNILVFSKAGTESDTVLPFRVKIGDFVRSVDLTNPQLPPVSGDEAVEEDLDDLYYVHTELFAMSRFEFAQYQAFKESLKLLTDIHANRNSIATLDKALKHLRNFVHTYQQPQAN